MEVEVAPSESAREPMMLLLLLLCLSRHVFSVVILGPQLIIVQHAIRLGDVSELVLCHCLVLLLYFVWVELERQLAVDLLDVCLGSRPFNAQYLVVVLALGLLQQPLSLLDLFVDGPVVCPVLFGLFVVVKAPLEVFKQGLALAPQQQRIHAGGVHLQGSATGLQGCLSLFGLDLCSAQLHIQVVSKQPVSWICLERSLVPVAASS
eukprot:TRINITY_DN2445_c0_g2_i3.p1 TRINITY_DN2445_c0_g2~~TRINITY_DN2445_c0_g2_i3.p1  ORF type:complete len:206 (+),score=18.45 TRINITY_DN2445_c0_g2_i3:89-706(+)